MICSTWRTTSKKLKSHQDGNGPTMDQLSNIVEFKTLNKEQKEPHIYLIVCQSLEDTHTLPQRELRCGRLYFNHTINQHPLNESTECNFDLEAAQWHRSASTLGERLVRSRLPLNPAEWQEIVDRATSPSQGMDFSPGDCTATLALSLIHTKTLNISAQVTFCNDSFPIVCVSRGWASTCTTPSRNSCYLNGSLSLNIVQCSGVSTVWGGWVRH